MIRLGLRYGALVTLVACMTITAVGQDAKKPAAKPDATKEDATKEDAAKKATDKAAPKTHKVKSERLKIEVNLTGVFEPTEMWPVVLRPESWSSFSVVKAVEHGAKVKKGDKLVWLDMKKINEQLQDMEHTMQLTKLTQKVAAVDFQLLQKTMPLDLKLAERAKRIANEELSYFMKVNRAFQEESAKFSLKSSQDSLEYAEEELKQLEKMYKADDLTEETEEIVLKRARNDVERARFYLKSSELRAKKTLEKDLDREEQQLVDAAQRAELGTAKATVSIPVAVEKQEIEQEKQRLADQRALQKLRDLQKDHAAMDIRSPAEGYVYYGKWTRGKWSGAETVASQLTEGGKLSANSVFITIVNPRPLKIRVDVPEKELHRLSRGVIGKAIPDGYPNLELAATLSRIAAFPISKGTFDGQFQVTLDDNARPVVPGMGCKLTVVAYDKKDAITVPAESVFEDEADGKRDVVYVNSGDGPAEKRKIVVGQKTDKKWEVLRGLNENEEILLKKPETS